MSIPFYVGEDEFSNQRNQRLLIMEEKKAKPNHKVITSLMLRTFSFRRRDILDNEKPVSEILKMFPSLKRLDQVY